jgi:hypothetical protein
MVDFGTGRGASASRNVPGGTNTERGVPVAGHRVRNYRSDVKCLSSCI